MARDEDETKRVASLSFPTPSDEDDISVDEWYRRKGALAKKTPPEEFASPGVLRRFAMWVLGRR
jgi:hypothetical protein